MSFRIREPKARINTTIPISLYQLIRQQGLFFNDLIRLGFNIHQEYPTEPDTVPQRMRYLQKRLTEVIQENKKLQNQLVEYQQITMRIREITVGKIRKTTAKEINQLHNLLEKSGIVMKRK